MRTRQYWVTLLTFVLSFTPFFALSGNSQAASVVRVETRTHFGPDNVGTGVITTPPFSIIPNLRDDDYADIAGGHAVTVSVHNGQLHYLSGSPEKLLDGLWPRTADEPRENTFFANDVQGMFLFDLNGLVDVQQINSYSRHWLDRTPQKHTVYVSDTRNPPSTAGNLEANGWDLLAPVNTLPHFVTLHGVAGVNITDSTGSLGKYRHVLFDIHGNNGFGTFYSEIDIVGTLVPEPSTLALLCIGVFGLLLPGKRGRSLPASHRR